MNYSYLAACKYRLQLLRAISEVNQYKKWSDEFSRKECSNAMNAGLGLKINLNEMTLEECLDLGFVWFDKEQTLLLVPLWLLPALDPEDYLICINGSEVLVDEADNDNRGGLLAYGIRK